MKIDILTIFTEVFKPFVGESILGRAIQNGIVDIRVTDVRSFTTDKHCRVDDTPFGGGAGMVMMSEPFYHALKSIGADSKKVVYMSPRGSVLDKEKIRELSCEKELVVLCGHYEGIDQRILDHWQAEEISIGDYILTGGELAAMVLVDAVTRMLPNVLGNEESHDEESIYSGLLEYPQYTKPREFMGMSVPDILLSGHHENIRLWRFERSLKLTHERRADLLERFVKERRDFLDKREKKVLDDFLEDKTDEMSKGSDDMI